MMMGTLTIVQVRRGIERPGARATAILLILWLALLLPTFSPPARAQDAPGESESASSKSPAGGGIPIFERKRLLRYSFGEPPIAVLEPAEDLARPDLAYDHEVHLVETIHRGDRETTIRVDGANELLLASRLYEPPEPELSNTSIVFGSDDERAREKDGSAPRELLIYAAGLDLDRQRGRRRERYRLTLDDGLRHAPETGAERRVRFEEAFGEAGSLLSVVSQPSVLRVRNGALLRSPDPSPLFEAMDVDWLDYVIAGLLPPLPERPLSTGRTWKAGAPILPSLYAEPVVLRFTSRFYGYDPHTGLADVRWAGRTGGVPLIPVPGIHHISEHATARIEVSGRLRIHVKTGWLKSAESKIRSVIINPKERDVTIEYAVRSRLDARETPESIRREQEGRRGPGSDDDDGGDGDGDAIAEGSDDAAGKRFLPLGSASSDSDDRR